MKVVQSEVVYTSTDRICANLDLTGPGLFQALVNTRDNTTVTTLVLPMTLDEALASAEVYRRHADELVAAAKRMRQSQLALLDHEYNATPTGGNGDGGGR